MTVEAPSATAEDAKHPANDADALVAAECPVLLERFSSTIEHRRPRILPCGHTFSVGCLQLLIPRNGRVQYVSVVDDLVKHHTELYRGP